MCELVSPDMILYFTPHYFLVFFKLRRTKTPLALSLGVRVADVISVRCGARPRVKNRWKSEAEEPQRDALMSEPHSAGAGWMRAPAAAAHARSDWCERASSRMVPAVSLWVLLSLCLLSQPGHPQKPFRCARACSCSRESIICVGISSVPRSPPGDISSL